MGPFGEQISACVVFGTYSCFQVFFFFYSVGTFTIQQTPLQATVLICLCINISFIFPIGNTKHGAAAPRSLPPGGAPAPHARIWNCGINRETCWEPVRVPQVGPSTRLVLPLSTHCGDPICVRGGKHHAPVYVGSLCRWASARGACTRSLPSLHARPCTCLPVVLLKNGVYFKLYFPIWIKSTHLTYSRFTVGV